MKTKDQIRLGPNGGAIRRSDEGVGFGTFTEVKEGQQIQEGAEIIQVGEENEDGWQDVTSIYSRTSNGPAQVATPQYRTGYDRIFGGKQRVGEA